MIKKIERSRDGLDALIDRTREAVVGAADRTERGVESAAKRVVKQTHLAGEHVRGGAEEASRDAHRHVQSAARALDRGYSRAHDDLARADINNVSIAFDFAAVCGGRDNYLVLRTRIIEDRDRPFGGSLGDQRATQACR